MSKKKKIAIIAAVAVAVIAAGVIGAFEYAKTIADKNAIGADAALAAAMADAGVQAENAVVTKVKMDLEKGILVYDIEFTAPGGEYDYTVKAADGTILEKETDGGAAVISNETTGIESTEPSSTQGTDRGENGAQTTAATSQTTAQSGISLEKAKSIALDYAGVSENGVQFTKEKTELDGETVIYEIEFFTSSYEYEFEIDLNGSILSYDKEAIKSTTAAPGTKYIGVDKAKLTALENAGLLSASNITFKKAKLEKEDGIHIYEIEFVSDSTEYEYKINATTGEIISLSSEPFDN